MLRIFETIVRRAGDYTDETSARPFSSHPFDDRNIYSSLPKIVKKLFDDGYYSHAVFEAYKYLEQRVKTLSNLENDFGFSLMMKVFSPSNPIIKLTPMITKSDEDEQKGFQFIFSGSILAIRNPRAHDEVYDSIDQCLDYLSLVSMLLRILDDL